MSKYRFVLALFALVVAGTFVACDDEDKPETTYGKALVMHAVPGGPSVDVKVDGATALSGVAYSAFSDYLQLETGSRSLSIAAGSTELASLGTTIEKDKNYTVIANLNGAAVRLSAFADDLTAPASGKAHLRVIHMCSDAPNVDVGVTDGTTVTPVFSDLAYNSGSSFVAVDAGTIPVAVVPTGVTDDAAAVATTDLTLVAGKIYTVVAYGLLNTGGDASKAFALKVITNN